MPAGIWSYFTFQVSTIILWGLLAVALSLQFGKSRIFNFGIAAFFSVGAYIVGILAAPSSGMSPFSVAIQINPYLAVVVGTVVAGILGMGMGLLTYRIKGAYLGMATLGVSGIIHLFITNAEAITGGNRGLMLIPNPTPFGGVTNDWAYLIILAVIIVISLFVINRALESPFGMILDAVGDNEEGVRILGRNPDVKKVIAFSIGGAIMGLAGGLFALLLGSLGPTQFTADLTFGIWAAMVVGGYGTVTGAFAGAVLIFGLNSLIRMLPNFINILFMSSMRLVLTGIIIVVVMRFMPGGFYREVKELWKKK